MQDLWLVFIAGLLGSAHCLGMCGGFALALGGAQSRTAALARHLTYQAGKTLTYTMLGALAGLFGSALTRMTGLQSVLSILAGAAMIVIGLGLVGLLDRIESFGRLGQRPWFQRAMRLFLSERSATGAFGVGLLNGLLPCGLIYGMLLKASAAGTLVGGAVTMLVFGLATVPALLALAMTGHLMRPLWRARMNLAGGVVVLLLGAITILRGTPAADSVMGFMHGGHGGHSMHEAAPGAGQPPAPATPHHHH